MMSILRVDVLPKWERNLYWISGIGAIFYCIFSFYKECQENVDDLQTEPGMKLLGGIKDSPDLEWHNFTYQLPYLVPLLIGHVFIGHLLLNLQAEIWQQKVVRLVYDIWAISYLFGIRATLLCLVQSLVMYLLTFQRHTFLVWTVVLIFTTSLNIEWIIYKQIHLVGYTETESVPFIISISYVHIRLISACTDLIKSNHDLTTIKNRQKYCVKEGMSHSGNTALLKEDKSIDPTTKASFIDFISYIFYLPVFFQGPVLSFGEFHSQLTMFYRSNEHNVDYPEIMKRLFKIIFWITCVEVQSHFFYLSSVQANLRLVDMMSVAAIIGMGIWQGQFFHLKYLCLFGIGSFVSSLDGVKPPPLPACISWLYSFSDMWKYFDVGLYNFIRKYIYIPWGGSKAGFVNQILGTILAFAFVCYWHGAESAVLVWCCGNLAIIIIEISAYRFEHSTLGLKTKSFVGCATELRLRGLLAAPIYLMSALQVMFFFFSMEVGRSMVDKLLWNASWKTLVLEYAGFYFAIQNAMFARKWVLGNKNKR